MQRIIFIIATGFIILPETISFIHQHNPIRLNNYGITPKGKSNTKLSMIKLNKQQQLLKKLQKVKEQNAAAASETSSSSISSSSNDSSSKKLSAEEIKRIEDHKQFERLLNSESATLSHMNEYSDDNYLTREQEEEELEAFSQGMMNRFFEGDDAPSKPFEDLVSIKTEKSLSENDVQKFLPWLRRSGSKQYMIILCDPRTKSTELRQAVKALNSRIPKNILSKVCIINADAPSENRKWIKKNQIHTASSSSSLQILSDEKREWMRAYTALGEKRWYITMFLLADGKIQKLVRELDYEMVVTIVENSVKSYET